MGSHYRVCRSSFARWTCTGTYHWRGLFERGTIRTDTRRQHLYGHSLVEQLIKANERESGATIFAYHVKDPERYGIVELNKDGKALSIEEKPLAPRSNYAITGLYFYDALAPSHARQIKPSGRGELEITDLNRIYLQKDQLHIERLGRGRAWFDAGTHESLVEANQFVQAIENRQGLKIACPEEIAFLKSWIDQSTLISLAQPMLKNEYGQYLLQVIAESNDENT